MRIKYVYEMSGSLAPLSSAVNVVKPTEGVPVGLLKVPCNFDKER